MITTNAMLKYQVKVQGKPSISVSRSDVEYISVMNFKGHSIRINVRSNSYEHQCYARVSVFNPQLLQWNLLDYIPYTEMTTPKGLCHQSGKAASVLETQFVQDVDNLLERAAFILPVAN